MQTAVSPNNDSRWLQRLLLVPFVVFAIIALLMAVKFAFSLHDRFSWLNQAEMTRGVVRQHLIKHVPQRFGMKEKLQLAIYYNDKKGHWHEFVSKSDLTEYNPFATPPQVGERLWLYYLPNTPNQARLAGFNAFWLPVILEGVFLLFSALLGFVPLIYIWLQRRHD
ncbi:DUF3592 domain-containing protein [Gallaecimonas kandeliae]|uniref:DUF3592 domain-containing protein n=1 Tax=Gallaecimonas kandeliae TaxID=3029055 RepID=UPI00264A0E63|nr:DUF3592 domain-containing protein [Gallaecimonas kandeliae]WKE63930.1 DUF3592 domain-containing protein [Gallaecimonas kandeliae]